MDKKGPCVFLPALLIYPRAPLITPSIEHQGSEVTRKMNKKKEDRKSVGVSGKEAG